MVRKNYGKRIGCIGMSLLLGVSSWMPVFQVRAEGGTVDLSENIVAHYTFDGNKVDATARTVENEVAGGTAYNGVLVSLSNANTT